jgi:hypothetical protein
MPSGFYDRQAWKRAPWAKSGMKGVIYQGTTVNTRGERVPLERPWRAYITHQGRMVTIGYFATKDEAARAYNIQALQFYGEEAWLNPVSADCPPVALKPKREQKPKADTPPPYEYVYVDDDYSYGRSFLPVLVVPRPRRVTA